MQCVWSVTPHLLLYCVSTTPHFKLPPPGGYVGVRVVGGKNSGSRMFAKVVMVRLGSPADLCTSVKPG